MNVLGKTLKDFANNSSVHGFQYLTPRRGRTCLERTLWAIMEVVAIYLMIYMLLFSWNQFMNEPTVTTLESTNYPITDISFPGIAICNINKISLNKATIYAHYLSNKTGLPMDKIFDLINNLGKLYEAGNTEFEEDLSVYQNILNQYDSSNFTDSFDTYDTLKKLSIPCSELISHCRWNGVKYNCKDLFVYSTTMEGFCCVFNYASQISNYQISRIMKQNNFGKLYTRREGSEGGLSVTIHSNTSDYFYTLVSSVGANIHIFNSDDYPDTSSGNLQERIVPMGVEMFIRLYATKTYAVQEVKKYSIEKRNCKFRDEAQTWLGLKYSYSDCTLDCRLKSMLALCQCIPFMFIKAISGQTQAQCTLLDIPCIHRYRDKWRRLNPYNFKGLDELDREKQDSLLCSHCIPTCNSTLYTVKNDFAFLTTGSSNYSIVNIFFESSTAQLYKQDVVFYWYEIMSNFGGSCSLVMGLSLISVFELLYYTVIVLFKNVNRVY